MTLSNDLTRGFIARVFLAFACAYFFSALLRAVTATLAPAFSAGTTCRSIRSARSAACSRLKVRGVSNCSFLPRWVVRRTMIEISGKRPEDLPPAEDIKQVHKKLKSSHREIKKLDKPKS